MKESDPFPLGLYQGVLFYIDSCMHSSARRSFIKRWYQKLAAEDRFAARSPEQVAAQNRRLRQQSKNGSSKNLQVRPYHCLVRRCVAERKIRTTAC